MSFWDNNKDSFKSAGKATIRGIGKGGKAIGSAGASAYKNRNGSSSSTTSEGPTNSFATGTGPSLQKVDESQLKAFPAPPRRNVAADGTPIPGAQVNQYHAQVQPPPQPANQYQPQAIPEQPVPVPAQPQIGYSAPDETVPPAYQQQQQAQLAQQPAQQFQLPSIQPDSVPAPFPARPVPAPPPRQVPAPGFPPQTVPQQPPAPQQELTFENPYHQPPVVAIPEPEVAPAPLAQPQPTQMAPFRRAAVPLPPQSPLTSPELVAPVASAVPVAQVTQVASAPTAAPISSPTEEPEKPKIPLPDPKSFPPPVVHKDRARLAAAATGGSGGASQPVKTNNTSNSSQGDEPTEISAPKKAYSLEIDKTFAPPPKPFRGPGQELPPTKVQNRNGSAARSTPPAPPSRGSAPPTLPTRGSDATLPPPQSQPLSSQSAFPPPPKPFRPGAESVFTPTPTTPIPAEPIAGNVSTSELAKKKGPPPKPTKKSSSIAENKGQSPPPPYAEDEPSKPTSQVPNFAAEIALRKSNGPKPSVKLPVSEPEDEELPPPKPVRPSSTSQDIPPPKPTRPTGTENEHPPPMPARHLSRTNTSNSVIAEKTGKPQKPAKPEKPAKPAKPDKPAKPTMPEKPANPATTVAEPMSDFMSELRNSLRKTVPPPTAQTSSEEVAEKKVPDTKPKPSVKPKPSASGKAPVPPPSRTPSAAASTPPPPPAPRLKSPPASAGTPPPPPPTRSYKRAPAPAPAPAPVAAAVQTGPPDLDLELASGWFANFAQTQTLPKSLQGLSMKYSYQSSTMGSTTRHQSNFGFRLKDLAIIAYSFVWTNDNYANVQVEIVRFVPSPIVANVPSKTELVEYHTKFGEYVASWCEHKQGQKVATGECWDLARDALLKGCGKHAFVSSGTHHGYPILSVSGSASGVQFNSEQADSIRRGDVLQFERCSFYNAATGRTSTAGDPDHTSVVLHNDGEKLTVAEQNVGGVKIVVKGEVIIKDLKAGSLTVYRPVPAEWAGEL